MAATSVASPSLPSLWSPAAPVVVPFGLNEHQIYNEADTTTETMDLPDIFFVQKMVTVLQDLGYSADSQRKVAELVDANTITAVLTSDNEAGSGVDAGVSLCQLLLDEKMLQSKGVRLNSNEPVLLVEVSKEALTQEGGRLENVKAGLLTALRSKGVKSVRVYLRALPSQQGDQLGIKASILNVVNTNLGGPSMVQLLDAAFEGVGWQQEVISKEAWNGYDLIWHAQAVQQKPVLSQQETIEESIPKTDSEVVPEPEVKVLHLSEEQQPPQGGTGSVPQGGEEQQTLHADENVTPKVSTDSAANKHPQSNKEKPEVHPVEHPEMTALREREAQRIAVQHPTWAREHEGESLLDIITTQSAGMTVADPSDAHPSVADPISVIIGSSTGDEKDDFEVVEKP